MNLLQCRMARAALNWTSRQLAQVAEVPNSVVNRFLAGHAIDRVHVTRMRRAFEGDGLVFMDDGQLIPGGVGVRLRTDRTATSSPSGPATDVVKMMDAAIEEHEMTRKR